MAVLVYFLSYSGVNCFPFLVQVDPESVSEAKPQEVVEVVQTPGGGEKVAEQSARPAVLAIKSPLKDRMRSASACGFDTSTPVSLVVCVFFFVERSCFDSISLQTVASRLGALSSTVWDMSRESPVNPPRGEGSGFSR